ncbi:MBL fold metallo-hydrolase [Myxococcus llanfairpwllgwyngyllgogerychwyrndrobwllllantysiliogogogochensis]|uniref:MBL fold metallo-hydrolase n=1 Tax=Myxococcus llanfairpwllgwyngyllgogerychwyrndrobwllllantysiliogogogochensis TaxID=2590453 RepID=A0A540X8S9_9BACT|nr:MBL fold metallo-hydrolase [Myxococcus llanfairpwllgwyngyllgogerychwyrndrobwllllantysiliogogogochensis]TQF17518.1 MBL fold metallo-hydrolase [Myxococcus llanfairpwllgwyngyllgogerychwyrndrobwllllantysiliogogogochensis]
MRFAPDVIMDLTPLPEGVGGVPFTELLHGLLREGFEPEGSRRLLEEARARLGGLLRPEGVDDGGFLVEPSVLFPEQGEWWWVLQQGEARWHTRLAVADVAAVADFLRATALASTLDDVREAWPFDEAGWRDTLFAHVPHPTPWKEPSGPGIYRREHASVVIRSRTTSVLVDPIPLQRRMNHIGQAPGNLAPGRLGAVAITHGHVDHWHVPSLLSQLTDATVPVLVPQVPRPNLLTMQDFAQVLGTCGQHALAPRWGETVHVGDIRVDVLPFYGEQPAPEGPPLGEGLRSWGNCYRFTTEDFSCLLLVDSGTDPEGRMEAVVARSRRELGPVDVVLSCQREFLSPFFGGLSHYWAALPWARLRALYADHLGGRLRSATAGPSGVAEVCAAAGARWFMPYANGFEGVGSAIRDVGWGLGEPSEAACGAAVRDHLTALGADTRVLDWSPGDVARFERGELRLDVTR